MHAELTPGIDLPAALLWDLDGTLVDSQASWRAAEDRFYAEIGGGPMSVEQHTLLVGVPVRDSARTMWQWAGRTDELDADAMGSLLNAFALEDLVGGGATWRPGAVELLRAARDAGVRCAVVTASWSDLVAQVVRTLPDDSFEVIVGGDHVTAGKPDPEPYRLAVERLGLAVRDCLALEDSIPGTTSAERAGLATLAVPFEQHIEPGPRRRLVPTLAGLDLAEVGRHWRELRDA